MINPFKSSPPLWPKLMGVAAAGGLAGVLFCRNFGDFEKKIRKRVQVDYGVEDPAFLRTMGQLLGPPLVDGNSVTILQNGEEIFPAMLAAIRSAERTITFENFLLKDGYVADAFAAALVKRARAGVKVHYLQDAMGCSDVHGRALNLVRDSPVELEIFRFYRLSVNFRTHRKLLIVDGKTAYIGGVGIADSWDGDGVTPGMWRDTHYQVEGPAVAQVQQAFMDNWMQTRAEVLHGDEYFPELEPAGPHKCQAVKSSASEGAEGARLMALFSIAAARRHIRIANAYFIPDNLCRDTLVEACERGVRVEIITPGPDLDAQIVRAVGKSRWRPLLEAGAHIYEYQPARFHCEYLLVDDHWASVGSANFDNRSLRLNEEANLNVFDADFCARHIEIFEEDKRRSVEVTLEDWRHRPAKEKWRGYAASFLQGQM